jgi:hypothetical protein
MLTFSWRRRSITCRPSDSELRQLLLVDLDLHLVLEAAGDLDRGHALDRLQALLQFFVGIAAQLASAEGHQPGRSALAGQHQTHDRLGRRVEAQQHRRLGFQRQAQHFELVAHLEAGRSMSVPQANSRITSLWPVRETERMRRRFLTTPTASSTGSVIRFSISAGAAPVYSVRTVSVG